MKRLILQRIAQTSEWTMGKLYDEDGAEVCNTLELGWRNNIRNISCIPSGNYKCTITDEGGRYPVIRVLNVPGRDGIQIHIGNYLTQIKGCILVGTAYVITQGLPVIINSEKAFRKLLSIIGNEKVFILSINPPVPAMEGITPK